MVIIHHRSVGRIQDWYGDRSKDFLIDSSICSGNRGGPVVLKPVLWSANHKRKITHPRLMSARASYLPHQDFALSQQTGQSRHIPLENSGPARGIPADAVIEITSSAVERCCRLPAKFVSRKATRAAAEATIRSPEHST